MKVKAHHFFLLAFYVDQQLQNILLFQFCHRVVVVTLGRFNVDFNLNKRIQNQKLDSLSFYPKF